jgi:hypothetical protein
VKQRVYPMLEFNKFENEAVTIGGIELAPKIKLTSSSCRRSMNVCIADRSAESRFLTMVRFQLTDGKPSH